MDEADGFTTIPTSLTPDQVRNVEGGSGERFDITFVGGGPVGLFGAFYAGLRGMRVKIIEALDQLGGQLTALYPEKYLLDIPGFPRVTAKGLVENLVAQAGQFGPTVCLGETVRSLVREENGGAEGGGWVIQTLAHNKDGDGGGGGGGGTSLVREHRTRTLVLCVGAGAFQAKKILLSGVERFEGAGGGLHYFVRSKEDFKGKRLLIIGGGDSAVDWALHLSEVADEVTLIHRRNQFRAHEASVKKMLASKVKVLTYHELEAIESADGVTISGAVLGQNQTKQRQTIQVDAVLAQLGFNSSLGMLRHWPVVTQGGAGAAIVVDSQMRTNLPGVFAAGDIAVYPGKIKLIATGFGEAATAANTAKTEIDPRAKLFPGHSSEMISHQPLTTVD